MPGIDGGTLRAWRRSRGWDVPEVARQLRYAARESAVHVAAHAGLIRMIYAWERVDHDLSERYELLYRKAGFPGPAGNDEPRPQPGSSAAGGQEDDPVRRALRAAEQTAPEEVAARPAVCALARNLAALAPPGIRRDAEQFASRIGAAR